MSFTEMVIIYRFNNMEHTPLRTLKCGLYKQVVFIVIQVVFRAGLTVHVETQSVKSF